MAILPFDTPRGGGNVPARVGSRVQRSGPRSFPGKANGGVFPGRGATGGVFPGGVGRGDGPPAMRGRGDFSPPSGFPGRDGSGFPGPMPFLGGGQPDFGGGGVPRHSGGIPSPVLQHSGPMPLPVQQGGGLPRQAAGPFGGGFPGQMPENIQALLAQILMNRGGF